MPLRQRSERRIAYFGECTCGERIPEGGLLHTHHGELRLPTRWWGRPADEPWRTMIPMERGLDQPQYDCPECGGSGEYEDGETCHCCAGSGWVSWDPNEAEK